MGAVAPDADVLIGFLDDHDAHHERAVARLESHLRRGNLVLAASVYAEALIRPLRLGRAEELDSFIAAAGIPILAIDAAVARRAATLRASEERLRLPDALALASALAAGARLVTFDERLRRIAERISA